MTEALYGWLQSLVCYFILLSAVMNFLPDNSYKKYIQYYMGLLLILIILAPVFRITSIQEKMDEYVSQFQDMESSREEWMQKAQEWEENWKQDMNIVEGEEVVP